MEANEELWLDQAQNGDRNAFSSLVELYQHPVYNLCYRMLGNAEDAEDASQETFMRAFRSIRRYDRSRPFSTWLLSIAAHLCIDQIRRRRPVISVEDLPIPDLPDPNPGMETNLARKQERERVRVLLDSLDPIDRAAVVLYYWYDYSYAEIGQILSISESALKSRLHRSRRAMAAQWMQNQPRSILEGRVFHESSTV